MRSTRTLAAACLLALPACGAPSAQSEVTPDPSAAVTVATADTLHERLAEARAAAPSSTSAMTPPNHTARAPNELGRIPILQYHLIGDREGRWERSVDGFRRDLEVLYERGYRPITVADLIDDRIDLPAGLSPVVFTFDDASPGQFRYIEREDGELEIDPTSAVGIWLEFNRRHSDWGNKAVFCMLSGAAEGRSFFGDRGIEGQKTAWRLRKVRFLAEQGFELCNHTLWHANLARYDDDVVQEQIARGALAIDSAVAGYPVRSFALPLGEWPKNRELAREGAWTDPKTGRTFRYRNDAILLVAGGSARSPRDPAFDPLRLPRVQVLGDELVKELDRLERSGQRYVAGGNR